MKSYCVIPVLIFLLLMLAYQCSKAQAQDYAVTLKGDTIRGEVKPISYGFEKKVQVTTSDKKKTTLPIIQTKGYSFHGEIYHPVRHERGYVFMKLIKPGYLSLYAFQLENQMTYDGLYLIKKDGTKTEVPNLGFKKTLTKFLADCKFVSAKIDKGELNKRELNQIIDEYNACIETKSEVTIKAAEQQQEAVKKISSWDALEEKIKAEPDFNGKKDALEMVSEIKNKLSRSEKVPNFLLEGLKSTLGQANVKTELDNALKEVNN